MNSADEQAAIAATRRWVDKVVIGLNLCPFARRVIDADRVRYVVTAATDEPALVAALTAELHALVATPRSEVETTLLIHPAVLGDFLDYNDFLGTADDAVADLGLTGVVQVASFHPGYRFAGTPADAVENFTNRSPYPMLHLLREASVTEVAGRPEYLEGIPRRNVETLRALGKPGIAALLDSAAEPLGSTRTQ